jgi:HK97 family phage prohead protease
MEKRLYDLRNLRAEDGERRSIRGIAALYNVETIIGGAFREVIRPGAFSKTLQERDQVALWNHDTGKPLGRKSAGTLEIEDREDGIHVTIYPGNRSWDQDVYESIARGDVRGMSFGFDVVKDAVARLADGSTLVELLEIRLWEVSPVTFPAYDLTSVEARYVQRCADTTPEPDPMVHSVEPDPDGWRAEIETMRLRLQLEDLS